MWIIWTSTNSKTHPRGTFQVHFHDQLSYLLFPMRNILLQIWEQNNNVMITFGNTFISLCLSFSCAMTWQPRLDSKRLRSFADSCINQQPTINQHHAMDESTRCNDPSELHGDDWALFNRPVIQLTRLKAMNMFTLVYTIYFFLSFFFAGWCCHQRWGLKWAQCATPHP